MYAKEETIGAYVEVDNYKIMYPEDKQKCIEINMVLEQNRIDLWGVDWVPSYFQIAMMAGPVIRTRR